MKTLFFVLGTMGFMPQLCQAAESETERVYPKIGSAEIQAVFEPDFQDHKWYADFLCSYEIPKMLRSAINVTPFYASSVVPELHFLWLRYFAALSYDKPEENEKAKANFRQALELLETNKQEGAIALWKNAWEEGNPEAYVKLQEIFKEYKDWCKVLSHFPSAELEMKKTINEARESLEFFYGSAEGAEKLSLDIPHISIAFASFEEARLTNALNKKEIEVEKSVRHLLQGVHVHYRKQWTHEIIGEMFGVSQSSVSNFLRGKPCPTLVQNVRKHYEENPDFYFFEPRKKRGWGISWRSLFSWGSSGAKKSSTDEIHPLIETQGEKKRT